MKLEMTKTAAGPEFAYCVGLVYDIPKDRGEALVKAEAAQQTKRKLSPITTKE